MPIIVAPGLNRRTKRGTLLCAAALASVMAAHSAQAFDRGLDILEINTAAGSRGDHASLLTYDRDTGKGKIYSISHRGIETGYPVRDFNWRKTWTNISYVSPLISFHSGPKGDVQLYQIHKRYKHLKTYSKFRKGFDLVTSINHKPPKKDIWKTTRQYFIYYDKHDGAYKTYAFNPRHKNYGAPVQSGKWTRGWDFVAPPHRPRDGKRYLMFYDRDTGSARMYKFSKGKLGKRTYDTKSWRKSWDLIAPMRTSRGAVTSSSKNTSKDLILLYDRAAGEGAIYEFNNSKGRLGKHVVTHTGWRKTWDYIGAYGSGHNYYVLFYDKESGDAAVYNIKKNGKLGKLISTH